MRKQFFIITLCLSALLLTANSLAAKYSQDYAPNELLIKFKTSFNRPSIDTIDAKGTKQKPSQFYAQAYRQKIQQKLSKHHVTHQTVYSRLGFEHWTLASSTVASSTALNANGQSSKSLEETIEQLKNDPDVLLVEPNYRRYPRSLHYISGASAKQLSDATLAQIKLQSLPGVSVGLRDSELLAPIGTPVVAIIDDAFEISHEDFPTSKIIFPRNSIELDSNPTPHSCKDSISRKTVEESHGTQVMGVLAAGVDNGLGLNGATDDSTQIIPIRVGCNYTVKAEVDAIEWAVQNDADIINMSYGSPLFSEFERIAILSLIKKNILVVAAAGNFEVNNDRVPDYPSGLGLPNIIAVAAVDSNNNLTKWSQYGQTSVDIAAPGDNFSISSTAAFNDDARNTGYVKTSGTSFSAPLVSGVAASLLARFPNASVYDVKGAIIGSAVSLAVAGDSLLDVKRFKGRMTSGGAIDAMAAADLLSSPSKPVVVIKNIRIDDSLGNKNGQIDAGEVIDIIVMLENIWADSNSLTVTLSSADLALSPIVINSFLGLEGFNSATTNRFGTVEKRFRVNFDNQMTKQNLLFLLDIEGEYTAIDTATNIIENKEFIYERAFRVNTGSLTLDNKVDGTLRVDDQDDVHYYHVYVPETKSKLIINLSMLNKSSENNLNLMVNRSQSPEFYFSLYDSNIANYVSRGTEVSANGGSQDESITLTDVSGGSTVYIAIAGSENIDATNIKYSINITGQDRELAKGSVSGCSLGGPLVFRGTDSGETSVFGITFMSGAKVIDPTLPLLLFAALFSLFIRPKAILH